MENGKAIPEMRKVLRRRSLLLLLPIGASVLLVVFYLGVRLTPLVGGEEYSGLLSGFIVGLLTGIDLFCLFLTFRTLYILRNDDRVYRQYILENDERKKYIREKCGVPRYFFSVGILLFCGIVAGYFSQVAFFAFLAAVLIEIAIQGGTILYYSKSFT